MYLIIGSFGPLEQRPRPLPVPEDPCTYIVYTWALKYSRYNIGTFRPKYIVFEYMDRNSAQKDDIDTQAAQTHSYSAWGSSPDHTSIEHLP